VYALYDCTPHSRSDCEARRARMPNVCRMHAVTYAACVCRRGEACTRASTRVCARMRSSQAPCALVPLASAACVCGDRRRRMRGCNCFAHSSLSQAPQCVVAARMRLRLSPHTHAYAALCALVPLVSAATTHAPAAVTAYACGIRHRGIRHRIRMRQVPA